MCVMSILSALSGLSAFCFALPVRGFFVGGCVSSSCVSACGSVCWLSAAGGSDECVGSAGCCCCVALWCHLYAVLLKLLLCFC